jgi:hypothetical protein
VAPHNDLRGTAEVLRNARMCCAQAKGWASPYSTKLAATARLVAFGRRRLWRRHHDIDTPPRASLDRREAFRRKVMADKQSAAKPGPKPVLRGDAELPGKCISFTAAELYQKRHAARSSCHLTAKHLGPFVGDRVVSVRG